MNETFKIYLHLNEDQLDIMQLLALILERRARLVGQTWIELTEDPSIEIKTDKDSDDLETVESSQIQIDLNGNVIVKSSVIATVDELIEMKILSMTGYEYFLCKVETEEESIDVGYSVGLEPMYRMIDQFLEESEDELEIKSISIVQQTLEEIIDWSTDSKGENDVQ